MSSSGTVSPYAISLHGSPYAVGMLAAPAGTPAAGWTPRDPAGTPAGTHTPDPRQTAGNDRARFLSVHGIPTINAFREAFTANLDTRLSETTKQRREKAMEQGYDALDLLLGENGDQEMAKYLVLPPENLASELVKLYFGTFVDPSLLHEDGEENKKSNARLETVFSMEHLTEEDRKFVRSNTLQEIHVLDGKGLGGDHVAVGGNMETLDPAHRDRLHKAARLILNSLEYGQWALQLNPGSGNAAAPSAIKHEGESSS